MIILRQHFNNIYFFVIIIFFYAAPKKSTLLYISHNSQNIVAHPIITLIIDNERGMKGNL